MIAGIGDPQAIIGHGPAKPDTTVAAETESAMPASAFVRLEPDLEEARRTAPLHRHAAVPVATSTSAIDRAAGWKTRTTVAPPSIGVRTEDGERILMRSAPSDASASSIEGFWVTAIF